MKDIMRALAYRLTYKRIDERRLEPIHIRVEERDVSYFNLSTNRILPVRHDGSTYYFRECPRLVCRKDYFRNALDDFFGSLRADIRCESFRQEIPIVLRFSDDEIRRFEAYIRGKAAEVGFLRKLARTDRIAQKCGFSIWEKQNWDQPFFDRFGLDRLPRGTGDIAIYFLWCMRSAAMCRRMLRIAYGREYSCFGAVRSVSSRIVAQALGLSHMITDVRWCVLHIGQEKELFGLLSDAAPGLRMADQAAEPSGRLQRELMNLNVLDLICLQVDHGPNNYTLSPEGAVCAFDNDNPYTFFPIPKISGSFAGCGPFVDQGGRVARPYFDRELAERLHSLDIRELKGKLKPYLNFLQISALAKRIKKLKKALAKTQISRPDFLLSAADWNAYTAQQELSGKFGTTYLTKALCSGPKT